MTETEARYRLYQTQGWGFGWGTSGGVVWSTSTNIHSFPGTSQGCCAGFRVAQVFRVTNPAGATWSVSVGVSTRWGVYHVKQTTEVQEVHACAPGER